MSDREKIAVGILHHVSEISGRELREQMNAGRSWWFRLWNGPASFYWMMSRLEEAGKVVSWPRWSEEVPGVQVRWYKLKTK